MKSSLCALLCVCIFSVHAQQTIKGVVLDQTDHSPIPYANVFLNGDWFALTDSTGNFSGTSSEKNRWFSASHIAYHNATLAVEISNQGTVDFVKIYLARKNTLFDPVVITAGRAQNDYPVTITNIKGSALQEKNTGADMPILLESTPGAVATSDAGNGVGYTGLRIRGSDATRVNVTLNGVPYNDAESQQTYWVDLPDIASSVTDIQIQRGVGTSTYGLSSLGASINLYTNRLDATPYAKYAVSAGSFDLLRNTLAINSGVLAEHWFVEARGSVLHSSGYIDRADADLLSGFLKAAYSGNKYKSILDVFSGKENTYQAWGGVPVEILDTNRTYNPYTYPDQTDNYIQTHYQWHQFFYGDHSGTLQVTLNYTKGSGYYEQLEEEQYFSDYGANPPIHGADTLYAADMITQKWLQNDFYGAFAQWDNTFNKTTLRAGGAYYIYMGDHYGKVIWAEDASTLGYDHTYYTNDAQKEDANGFIQWVHNNTNWIYYADVQVRNVNYRYTGADLDGNALDNTSALLFINPKAGITWKQNDHMQTYVFAGMSGKEPNRDDFVASTPDSRPAPEHLLDLEAGERISISGWEFSGTLYYMRYRDQLVLTGEINDVGAYIRSNVPESYRAGVEWAWSKIFAKRLQWNANASFSQNKIVEHSEYVDNWDGAQVEEHYTQTDIAFSPNVVAYNALLYTILHAPSQHIDLQVGLESKYVGRQYVDNTESKERSLDPYVFHNIRFAAAHKGKKNADQFLYLDLYNVTNTLYESNAWVYRYFSGGSESMLMGLYPQAGIHWSLTLRVEI